MPTYSVTLARWSKDGAKILCGRPNCREVLATGGIYAIDGKPVGSRFFFGRDWLLARHSGNTQIGPLWVLSESGRRQRRRKRLGLYVRHETDLNDVTRRQVLYVDGPKAGQFRPSWDRDSQRVRRHPINKARAGEKLHEGELTYGLREIASVRQPCAALCPVEGHGFSVITKTLVEARPLLRRPKL